ncbi:MAG: hypothetical protein CTY20_09825 [Hyphomicrobium sp.]|nr:MAG: hypothetical protein CTY20_09825 [Hyphomicrobium sp.]
MSNSGRTEAQSARGSDSGNSGASDTGGCAAESLKSLISHIADQIADADVRHSEMLRQMQARLQSLGIEAQSIRDRVPGEYVPAFDRIEEGMQLLADRIASTHEGRFETPPSSAAGAYATPVAVSPQTADTTPGPIPATPPAAMPAAAAPATALDPWDRDSAEALANLYHGADQNAAMGAAGGWASGMSDPDADRFDHVDRLAAAAGHVASGSDIEREWLEDRFAEIAQRVEQSLAEMRPESSFLALGNRFEQFEQRMGSVLEDVATRADVEGLRIIEAHINELVQHLEQAQLQLERLDGIELQLGAVVDRLSDERMPHVGDAGAIATEHIDQIVAQAVDRVARQLSSARMTETPAEPSVDYQNLANMAAAQAVSRYAADFNQQARGTLLHEHAHNEDLRDILENFIRERRHGEAQTASVLDTMQQAIVRVLDRIDAIELSQHHAPVPAAPREYVREQVRFTTDPRESADLGSLRVAADTGKQAADAAAHLTSQMQARPYSAAPQSPFEHAPGAHLHPNTAIGGHGIESGLRAEPSQTPVPTPAAADGPSANGLSVDAPGNGASAIGTRAARVPIDKLRQDFIADAQRAKLKAQSQAQDAARIGPSAEAGVATLSAPKAPGARLAAASSGAAKSTSVATAAKGLPIKKILVGALGLVILVQGANLLLARRKVESTKPTATANPATMPQAKSAPVTGKSTPTIVNPAAVPAEDARQKDAGQEPALDLEQESVEPSQDEAGTDRRSEVRPPARVQTVVPKKDDGKKSATADAPKMTLPKVPGGPSSMPETLIEELNYENAVPSGRIDQRISDTAIEAPGGVPIGIALQSSSRPLTPYDLARLQQQQHMANMSSKLGIAAAKASPASLMPDRILEPQSAGNVAAALAEQAKPQKSALELPPLTVGPLSLRLAAAKGDPSAEFEVATRLAEGKGTEQSFKDAVKWYTRSATQGFAQAQYRLGTLYERGLGAKQDVARARVWYSRAAEQDNVKAMHNLAVLNAGTKTNAPDYAAAAHWFGEAASRGLADSQFNLAVLHESGLGVTKDQGLAYQWFALAARSGDKEAVRRRDLLKSQLAAAEVAEIDQRLAGWAPKQTDPMANDAHAAGEAWKARENAETNG